MHAAVESLAPIKLLQLASTACHCTHSRRERWMTIQKPPARASTSKAEGPRCTRGAPGARVYDVDARTCAYAYVPVIITQRLRAKAL